MAVEPMPDVMVLLPSDVEDNDTRRTPEPNEGERHAAGFDLGRRVHEVRARVSGFRGLVTRFAEVLPETEFGR